MLAFNFSITRHQSCLFFIDPQSHTKWLLCFLDAPQSIEGFRRFDSWHITVNTSRVLYVEGYEDTQIYGILCTIRAAKLRRKMKPTLGIQAFCDSLVIIKRATFNFEKGTRCRVDYFTSCSLTKRILRLRSAMSLKYCCSLSLSHWHTEVNSKYCYSRSKEVRSGTNCIGSTQPKRSACYSTMMCRGRSGRCQIRYL